jgi:8-oxo-dGTP diphosphatase
MGIERASRRGRLEAMRVVGAAIVEAGLCLVAQRGPAMAEPGKWEFPGGKVEAGENPRAALAREVAE